MEKNVLTVWAVAVGTIMLATCIHTKSLDKKDTSEEELTRMNRIAKLLETLKKVEKTIQKKEHPALSHADVKPVKLDVKDRDLQDVKDKLTEAKDAVKGKLKVAKEKIKDLFCTEQDGGCWLSAFCCSDLKCEGASWLPSRRGKCL